MSSDLDEIPFDADRLAELEEERRFLLRSLSDLEREHDAGDVDESDYVTLKDGYTARAATVLRAIDEHHAAVPERRKVSWTRRGLFVAIVVAIAVIAGWLVARSSGQRLPGDTITGGTSPNEVARLLSEGHRLMQQSDLTDATDRFLA